MCIGPPIEPPNERSRHLVNGLKIVFVALLILAGMKLASMNYGWTSDLIGIFLLYQAIATLDFCSIVVFIFYTAMSLVNVLISFGLLWQNNVSLSNANVFAFVVGVISMVVDFIAIGVAFYAYREFKAISMDTSGGNQSSQQNELSTIPSARQGTGAATGTEPMSSNQGFTAFAGRGVVISEP